MAEAVLPRVGLPAVDILEVASDRCAAAKAAYRAVWMSSDAVAICRAWEEWSDWDEAFFQAQRVAQQLASMPAWRLDGDNFVAAGRELAHHA